MINDEYVSITDLQTKEVNGAFKATLNREKNESKSNEIKIIRRMLSANEEPRKIRHLLQRYHDGEDDYKAPTVEEIERIKEDMENQRKD